jgi:sodium-dependent dicarboxylate transporter 2/3/5
MLPVGTPPNAIAYGTGRLKIKDMVSVGIVLDIVCAIILTVLTYYLAPLVFGFELGSFPDWAK